MTDRAWDPVAQPDGEEPRCAQRIGRSRGWRLVFGGLGLAFVCVALALAGTLIP